MVFWDTSAFLKLYVLERDSSAFARLAATEESLAISGWTLHEAFCSLHRKELLRDLRTGGADAIYDRILQQISMRSLHLIDYTATVAQRTTEVIRGCYGAPKPVAIRSLDALQLGSALASGALELVSADARMRAGANLFNLRISPASLPPDDPCDW